MNWETSHGSSLRACGVNQNLLLIFFQPFQGRSPSTEAEFQSVSLRLHHMRHILEGEPSNIASRLRAPPSRACDATDWSVENPHESAARAFMAQPQQAQDP